MAWCIWTFLVMLCMIPRITSVTQSTKNLYPRIRLSHKGKAMTGVCVEDLGLGKVSLVVWEVIRFMLKLKL